MGSFLQHLLVLVIIGASREIAFSDDIVDVNQVTDVFKEKWGIVFDMFDHDFDGIFTLEECYNYIEQQIAYLHASGDVVNGLMQACTLYNEILEDSFGVYTTKTGVTRSEYINAVAQYWSNHFDEFSWRLHTFYTALFHAMDANNDGTISFNEFYYYYKPLGDNDTMKERAMKAFKHIDTDGDACITEDEYVDAYSKYILSPDIPFNELPVY